MLYIQTRRLTFEIARFGGYPWRFSIWLRFGCRDWWICPLGDPLRSDSYRPFIALERV